MSTASDVHFNFRSSFPHIRASSASSSSSSLDAGHLSLTLLSVVQNFIDSYLFYYLIGSSEKKKYSNEGLSTELDAVSSFSEIVPDTVVFDDFERY